MCYFVMINSGSADSLFRRQHSFIFRSPGFVNRLHGSLYTFTPDRAPSKHLASPYMLSWRGRGKFCVYLIGERVILKLNWLCGAGWDERRI